MADDPNLPQQPMEQDPPAPPPPELAHAQDAPGPPHEAQIAFLWDQIQHMQHNLEVIQQNQAPINDPSTSTSRLKPKTPDTYNGSYDPQTWLFQLRVYFRASNMVDEQQMVNYGISLLRGNAALYWRQLEELGVADTITSLTDFGEAITSQFQPINPQQVARDELASLTQRNMTIQEYRAAMTRICLQLPQVSDEEKKDRFIRGLRNPRIREEVFIRDPPTFDGAAQMAERLEASLRRTQNNFRQPVNYQNKGSNPWRNHQSYASRSTYNGYYSQPTNRPVPMEIGNVSYQRRNYDYRPRRLTDRDRDDAYREGKCFYCREKGHIAKDCPKKKKNMGQGNANTR